MGKNKWHNFLREIIKQRAPLPVATGERGQDHALIVQDPGKEHVDAFLKWSLGNFIRLYDFKTGNSSSHRKVKDSFNQYMDGYGKEDRDAARTNIKGWLGHQTELKLQDKNWITVP